MKLLRPPRPFSLHTSRHLMRLLGRSDDQWRKYLFFYGLMPLLSCVFGRSGRQSARKRRAGEFRSVGFLLSAFLSGACFTGLMMTCALRPSSLGWPSMVPTSVQILCEPQQEFLAEVDVRDFAAAELDNCFDAVSVFQEPDGMILLEIVVVIVGVGAKLQFLHLDHVLLLLGVVLLLLLFVLPLAIIHGLGNRWFSRGSDDDQIESQFLRLAHCGGSGHDLDRSVGKHCTDFSGSDRLVYVFSNSGPARREISRWIHAETSGRTRRGTLQTRMRIGSNEYLLVVYRKTGTPGTPQLYGSLIALCRHLLPNRQCRASLSIAARSPQLGFRFLAVADVFGQRTFFSFSAIFPLCPRCWKRSASSQRSWPRLLPSNGRAWQRFRRHLEEHPVDLIVLAARGTSDNAAQFGRYLLEIATGLPVSLAAASVVTLYGRSMHWKRALVVAISQSGESTDTNLVLEHAKSAGALTLGITNEAGSTLANLGHETMLVHAGKEKSVAATKTYTGQLMCCYLLACALGAAIDRSDLERIPAYAEAALTLDPEVKQRVERYRFMHRAVCVGRGLNYANSFESALKMMETCYVVAERFSAADLLHGPIAMLEESFPAFAFCPSGVTWDSMSGLLERMLDVRAETLAITDRSHPEPDRLASLCDDVLTVPSALRFEGVLPEDVFTPIPYIIPMQLFAAHLATAKRLNPDQPRTLSKVTKTV